MKHKSSWESQRFTVKETGSIAGGPGGPGVWGGAMKTEGGNMTASKGEVARKTARGVGRIGALLGWLWLGVAAHSGWAQSSAVELASGSFRGPAGNAASSGPAISADGRFVAFFSSASDLVRGDTNEARDVFVRDRSSGQTERVSVSDRGAQANGPSQTSGDNPAISADGSVVAFDSEASNLVAADRNQRTDVFVRLRTEGTTELVSVSSAGEQGNGPSSNPTMDATGRWVAFQSLASNLVPNDRNGVSDIFVRDRQAGTTERLCGAVEGNGPSSQAAMSADGQVVAFVSAATNLIANDTNGRLDVFVCDRRSGRIEVVSINARGELGNGDSILPAISADGRFVAFKSLASNLVEGDHNEAVDVFVHDRSSHTTERISTSFLGGDSNGTAYAPAIDCSGRFVAFGSEANNLYREDYNQLASLFLRDRESGRTFLVDVSASGIQADGPVLDIAPALSCQPLVVAFASLASNLGGNDPNQHADVYVAPQPIPRCRTDADCRDADLCTSDRCGEDGLCRFEPIGCPPAGPCLGPGVCDATTGACTYTPLPDGSSCDDGNLCTRNDRCSGGHCVGTPLDCSGADGCHDPGACDPATGLCPNPRPDGTSCNDGNLCTTNDRCEASLCVGTGKDCSGADGCHDPGVCDPRTGLCPNPRPDGTACSDGNLCTVRDQCVASLCIGTPKNCSGEDGCHDPGTCDPTTGLCPNPRPDGTACSDANRCTLGDRCEASVCVGTPRDCSVTDGCHDVGVCDPATGQCPNPRPDGTACSDGNLCTLGDQCQAGTCVGTPRDCSRPDGCHDAGECNPATGLCPNPQPDGTSCSTGNFCVVGESCLGGFCRGGQPRNCDDGLFCSGTERCDEASRRCVSSGNPCTGGTVCDEAEDACISGEPPTATPTPTSAATATPATPRATATGTPVAPGNGDGCGCDVDPQAPRSYNAAWVWLSALLAIAARCRWRRREQGSSLPR